MSNDNRRTLLTAYFNGGSVRVDRANSIDEEDVQYILQAFLTAGDEARANGDLDKAERFYHETIKLATRELDRTTPEIALAKFHLSMIYLDRGVLVAADAFAKSALKTCVEVFGEDHPATGMAMHQLAEVHIALNRIESTSPLGRHAANILNRHCRGYKNDTPGETKPRAMTESLKAILNGRRFEGERPGSYN